MSAVARGRAFEAAARKRLALLGMDLAAVGSAGDRGVDLVGTWSVAGRDAVPVVVQCKRLGRALAPRDVRELVGVVSDDAREPIGVLVSHSPFTVQSFR